MDETNDGNELEDAIAIHGPNLVIGLTWPVRYALDGAFLVMQAVAMVVDVGAAIRDRLTANR